MHFEGSFFEGEGAANSFSALGNRIASSPSNAAILNSAVPCLFKSNDFNASQSNVPAPSLNNKALHPSLGTT
jgi:hypothetical protein